MGKIVKGLSQREVSIGKDLSYQESPVTEIKTKSSQDAYKMYKLVNFWNLSKKMEKNAELCQKG